MYRKILNDLKKWKNDNNRKPLILRGARQVGKTYIINQFGIENYEAVAYFNFDHDTSLYNLFKVTSVFTLKLKFNLPIFYPLFLFHHNKPIFKIQDF